MNARGVTSVNALRRALPFDGLLYLAIFGSQVRGTERPDSDLDVLFVVRTEKLSCYTKVRKAVTETPGGVRNISIIPHIPETIAGSANVYGTVEYGVLRGNGARTLYRSADFDVPLHADIDYEYCAKTWLYRAEKHLFSGTDSKSEPASTCFCAYIAMDNLLRANLISIKTEFPFTRDVRVLYGMLPLERSPPLDIDAIANIRERYEKDDDENAWSIHDVRDVQSMAKQMYNFTCEVLGPTALGREA